MGSLCLAGAVLHGSGEGLTEEVTSGQGLEMRGKAFQADGVASARSHVNGTKRMHGSVLCT